MEQEKTKDVSLIEKVEEAVKVKVEVEKKRSVTQPKKRPFPLTADLNKQFNAQFQNNFTKAIQTPDVNLERNCA